MQGSQFTDWSELQSENTTIFLKLSRGSFVETGRQPQKGEAYERDHLRPDRLRGAESLHYRQYGASCRPVPGHPNSPGGGGLAGGTGHSGGSGGELHLCGGTGAAHLPGYWDGGGVRPAGAGGAHHRRPAHRGHPRGGGQRVSGGESALLRGGGPAAPGEHGQQHPPPSSTCRWWREISWS